MGMELYANSAVARAVWDQADEHLGEVYGFSILEIVRVLSFPTPRSGS
jgi:fatty acid synthase subunit alpha, fungi type